MPKTFLLFVTVAILSHYQSLLTAEGCKVQLHTQSELSLLL